MASNSNSPTQSAAQIALGREYAIMLGAQPLSGLASLINWTNNSSYQRPSLDPWGHIALSINSDAAAESATPATPLPSVAPVASVEVAPPVNAPAIAEPEPKSEVQSTQVVDPIPPVTPASKSPDPEILVQAPQITKVPEPVAPKPDAQATATPAAVASASVAPEPARSELPRSEQVPFSQADSEQIVAEPASVTPAQPPLQAERAPEKPSVAERELEKAKETAPEKETKRVVALESTPQSLAESPKTDTIAASAQQSVIVDSPKDKIDHPIQSKPNKVATDSSAQQSIKSPPVKSSSSSSSTATPVTRPSNATQRPAAAAMPEWKPNAKVARPSDATSTGDEYLRQLERLIIELNMELGMREGESPAQETDQMSLLVQRMIDLNLQNLALKEQLREAASPTL